MSKQLALVLVVVMLLSACAPAAAPAKPEEPTLRIGTLPILDLLPLFVAEKQGYFKAQGITVTFVPAQSAAERDQLMQAGQIDGMNNDMVSTVLYNKDIGQDQGRAHRDPGHVHLVAVFDLCGQRQRHQICRRFEGRRDRHQPGDV